MSQRTAGGRGRRRTDRRWRWCSATLKGTPLFRNNPYEYDKQDSLCSGEARGQIRPARCIAVDDVLLPAKTNSVDVRRSLKKNRKSYRNTGENNGNVASPDRHQVADASVPLLPPPTARGCLRAARNTTEGGLPGASFSGSVHGVSIAQRLVGLVVTSP
ncbi:hypothetical protein GWI33_004406 [Rhynchophorus ferrugineus]|uniref:Uncharacterized protein n=1 Tax=Rhynchophorus ferrugineus TaxID=354439 RepID=A0A834MIR4_RHYFE|nr:hypothetical protein GWI33_004406 [Rhynchophorus ferrugineus]